MSETALPGYILIAPQESTFTYLVDRDGAVVHTWKSDFNAGLTATLTEDGHLFRAGKVANDHYIHGSGGVIEEYDWDGNLVWQYFYNDSSEFQHHDFTILPNGDVLFIAAEIITADEALALGRDPSKLRDGFLVADKLVEVKPEGFSGGEVVWQWRAIDHIIQDVSPGRATYGSVAAHPERIDFNYEGRPSFPDGWTHMNSVDYDPDTDQILISSRNYNEIWIIDHSTSTAEAAGHTGGDWGHGGDLLYRWGNPEAYRAGTRADRQLNGQHDAKWIDAGLPGAGDIFVFDNGADRLGGKYSRVLELTVPTAGDGIYYLSADGAYGPSEASWSYTADVPTTYYSARMSGAQRLPDGNTLTTVGDAGTLVEVTPQGRAAWVYDADRTLLEGAAPGSETSVFYATWYPEDYAGFAGKALIAQDATLGMLSRYATNAVETTLGTSKALMVGSPVSLAASSA
ncbi:MAG: Arylsulfotransferase (ASST) [Solidesulfovibrio magneticus str. Maddingley MBC34]|uniref:Arylsulfotransferase (ASST) n=1 Tax=Solidesulfovibrio magneticus str. Maddingley MBC34 TaxID=1206767 RepID=K6GGN9_9BACT|nr:MAG: Arylsulfotransferase (ASST) [Solidesulfovibrio magneticus str. Maddingley MBC34]